MQRCSCHRCLVPEQLLPKQKWRNALSKIYHLGDGDKGSFRPLVHSPEAHSGQGWARSQLGAGAGRLLPSTVRIKQGSGVGSHSQALQ